MSHTAIIANWHPATINQLLGHWSNAHKLKKSDRAIIAHYTKGLPKATGKRSVQIDIYLAKGKRAADCDAYYKSCLDGLKHAGMIIDDNRQNLELPPVRFERTPPFWGTHIILTDLDGSA